MDDFRERLESLRLLNGPSFIFYSKIRSRNLHYFKLAASKMFSNFFTFALKLFIFVLGPVKRLLLDFYKISEQFLVTKV